MRRILFSSTLLTATFLLATAASTQAQTQFGCLLSGANEVPPVPSLASGRAWFSLDPATNMLIYRVETSLTTGMAAHIHSGAVGVNGPVVFPLVGGPTVWQGATPPLTPAQITTLFSNGFYANVHTGAFPTGEIRGQIVKTVRRHFFGTLDGLQETPPVATPHTGTLEAILHVPENVLTYRIKTTFGVGPLPTAAHLHTGAVGVPGPVIFSLSGVAGQYCGTSPTLSAATITALLAGGTYFNIHSAAFPAGEIRGQIRPDKEEFTARATGLQEVPPNPSPATGFLAGTYDPATTGFSYMQSWTGLGGTVSHIHTGIPGVAGGVLFALVGPPNGPWAGASPIPAASLAALFSCGLYTNIHSAAFGGGEVRGAVEQNPSIYGFAGPNSSPLLGRTLRIGDSGKPFQGTTFGVTLTGALPGAPLSLAYCEDLVGTPLDLTGFGATQHVLWGNALAGYAAAADVNGCAILTFAVPISPLISGQDFFLQWFAIEVGANPLSLVTSDAMRVIVP